MAIITQPIMLSKICQARGFLNNGVNLLAPYVRLKNQVNDANNVPPIKDHRSGAGYSAPTVPNSKKYRYKYVGLKK